MWRNIANISRSKKDNQMNYIIFDLEWNQHTNSDKSPDLPHGEIIQIGYIGFGDDMKISLRDELTIKPVCYKKMNPYVSTLTGITQSDIDSGISFTEAFGKMSGLFGEDTVLITWGDDDMPILRENLSFHGLDGLDLPPHYNLQRIFAAQTGSKMRQTGLKTAAEALGITNEIKAHDALNDAYMTYLIAERLDIVKGIAEYSTALPPPKDKKAVHPWESETPFCIVNSEENVKPSGLAAACRKIHMCCPVCGHDLSGGEIIRQGKCSFLAMSGCTDKSAVFIRYELKEGRITASCFDMTEELENIYNSRVKAREKRAARQEMHRAAALRAKRNKKDD